MEKLLRLMIDVGGGAESTPFPNTDNPIEIGGFRYDAKRMGGAPTITASVNYPSCLDEEWTDGVYAEFNGEKYYLKQTPTSSYNNESTMYKHDLELVSERFALDNVYFYDAVSGDPQEGDKPVSHSAKVVFYGTIEEFKDRLNASLEYAGLDYVVSIDDGITSEAKLMSFDEKFFSNVLQEIYNTYELPYYFKCYVGEDGVRHKEIHIGYTDNVISEVFSYGVNNALLSITKGNANAKVVNRVTGVGSEENIPYYYPNDTPKSCGVDVLSGDFEVSVVDGESLETNTKIGQEMTYLGNMPLGLDISFVVNSSGSFSGSNGWRLRSFSFVGAKGMAFRQKVDLSVTGLYLSNGNSFTGDDSYIKHTITCALTKKRAGSTLSDVVFKESKEVADVGSTYFDIIIPDNCDGEDLNLHFDYGISDRGNTKVSRVAYFVTSNSIFGWASEGEDNSISSKQLGLAITGNIAFGDKIKIVQKDYINPQRTLMPPIYRNSLGDERFYPALEREYVKGKDENGDDIFYEFANPYTEGKPVEQIVEFPDIKPTIKGMKNADGEPIDEFLEFAFDENDNNEVDEEGNYIHSHFFAKLRKLPFNLFDMAIENGEMTINMTGGSLGGCAFPIAVSEADSDGVQWNTVQVDANGNLKRDDNGDVICGVGSQGDVEAQERQNDTRNNEVWIALKKDINYTTYARPTLDATAEDGVVKTDAGGTPIEGKKGHFLPYEGSTFVITNILLPKEYIIAAEERLQKAILDYLEQNNEEKFNFSISFSRIFLEENPSVRDALNENARLYIEYNGIDYLLYVSAYSYKMTNDSVLPEIAVELSESLSVSQNALQKAISEVKGDLLSTIGNIDILAQATPYFLRKDQRDRAKKTIVFEEGLEVGDYTEGTVGGGASIHIDENGSTHIEADYLKIRKKATFTQISVQEMRSVGGEIVVSPAAMVCSSVEELDNAYRCYFSSSDNEGRHIFNEFEIDDQARCQTFNVLGTKYYWRLVVGVGDNYIDLSKTDCDTNSDIPQAGDAIVSLGNRSNIERQSAIVHSAYGEFAPSMTQYAGIDSFDLSNKIVTRFSPKGNIITGKVHMELGSTIPEEVLGNLDETISNAIGGLEFGKYNLLRNSGFTGDFVTESLDDSKVLDENSQLFSDPLRHWTMTDGVVRANSDSQSGYECSLNNGSLKQEMMYNMIAGESYVFSFRGRGMSLTFSVGGVTKEITLGTEQTRYIEKFVATNNSNIFEITNASCAICELQLERGNVVSAWGHSMWDNQSELAKYQSLNYLETAMRNGSTDILGGLILTNLILLGNPEASDNNAGISGIRNDDNDVAFWGGGTYAQAIDTVMKYVEDPTYQPTDAEVASMAKAVITHGGRAILNDVVLRGYVYAKGGEFTGTVYAQSGVFSGFVKKTPTVITPDNYAQYLLPQQDEGWFDLDLSKAGSFVIFDGQWEDNPHFYMPQLGKANVEYNDDGLPISWKYYTSPNGYSVNDIFGLIGQKVIIMNNTNLNVQICTDVCSWIEPNKMAVYECEAEVREDEVFNMTYWKVNWTTKILETPDLTTIHPIE